ncbi:MAG: hypothetical protein IJ011_01895 [Clostridia bacterium]|nr:hypothetical protein [Clostridia bacterium]
MKQYIRPFADIIALETADVITLSGTGVIFNWGDYDENGNVISNQNAPGF